MLLWPLEPTRVVHAFDLEWLIKLDGCIRRDVGMPARVDARLLVGRRERVNAYSTSVGISEAAGLIVVGLVARGTAMGASAMVTIFDNAVGNWYVVEAKGKSPVILPHSPFRFSIRRLAAQQLLTACDTSLCIGERQSAATLLEKTKRAYSGLSAREWRCGGVVALTPPGRIRCLQPSSQHRLDPRDHGRIYAWPIVAVHFLCGSPAV